MSSSRDRGVTEPLASALDAYDSGRWSESERLARRALDSVPTGDESGAAGLRARWVLAFSAARRGDTRLARERFALLRDEASTHPSLAFRSARAGDSTGAPPDSEAGAVPPDRPVSETGEPLPTLEEEGAYQHAVLTAALAGAAEGESALSSPTPDPQRPTPRASALSSPTPDPQRPTPRESVLSSPTPDPQRPTLREAEAEFLDFIRRYPESPLVHAAVRRIARMHGGDLPQEAEAARKAAVAETGRRERLRARARSMCGPEVLAELLRRRSRSPNTEIEGSGFRGQGLGGTPDTAIEGSGFRGQGVGGTPNTEPPAPEHRTPKRLSARTPERPTLQPDTERPAPELRTAKRLNARTPERPNTQPPNTQRPTPNAQRLAHEMATDHRGTPLSAFVRAARNHGIVLKGYRLTWDGLNRKLWKSPPVVALVNPGHLVLVERADYTGVRIWDPALRERGGFRDVPRWQWDREWAPSGQGVALAAP